MRNEKLHPDVLIPTDCPRAFMCIVRAIRALVYGLDVEPITVVPRRSSPTAGEAHEYYVCDGHHRAAAAYICSVPIRAQIIEMAADLVSVREGRVARCATIADLQAECREEADGGHYLDGRWDEYLRMVPESGTVTFDEASAGNGNELRLPNGDQLHFGSNVRVPTSGRSRASQSGSSGK